MNLLFKKQKQELAKLREENAQLRLLLEEKRKQEEEERLRIQQMQNFWAYDGTPQEGFAE